MPVTTASSTAACDRRSDALRDAMVASSPRLLALATRMLGDHHAAEDAIQDAFARALGSLDRFRDDASMGTWLYRITANVCIDELRRRRRMVLHAAADDCHDRASQVDFTENVVARADLAAGLASLPPTQRAVLVLTHACGLNYAEAGVALSVPPGTVASRVHRAKETARAALTGPPRSGRLSPDRRGTTGARRSFAVLP